MKNCKDHLNGMLISKDICKIELDMIYNMLINELSTTDLVYITTKINDKLKYNRSMTQTLNHRLLNKLKKENEELKKINK
tara:strand:- start:2693 stop:2932 length:240 start_codon:yes stop_codon:yes gene_type:complete